MKGINDDEISDFINWSAAEDITVRFIELMQTSDNHSFFARHYYSAEDLRKHLIAQGFVLKPRVLQAGPAEVYNRVHDKARIGIIAPYSKDFCNTCNRLRVSATGKLMLCLFGDSAHDLRPYLQSDDDKIILQDKILALLHFKRSGHDLAQGNSGITPHLASIGG